MKKIVSELSATVNARILMKGAIKDLSIAVAYMLDDFDSIQPHDVGHLQDLITELENIINPMEEDKDE
jgi:hypothetical protein|tara:strand:+ start:5145 stop:5348 length:204 start_codon:yes stop_codon:yes gene_type:complete